ncbi:DUF2759 domain-containing protein [Alteribacillus iranensis]|uniref:DUF2759 domain-containing protein n=1 Tax=Alteribacillus iranensis TaxID=930128 RepID=A0A1I1ZF45_9BACI|nr:DUF2759 domain-containing protein [Alteribacillus iranensis]SFE30376.1 Protein of unknown function [Alteribacillus iranensis]
MAIGIMFLVATILCAFAVVREVKRRNFFAVGFAGISVIVFGFFSIMTIFISGAPEV